MPDYKFTGDFPRVMTGLIQGVNALVNGDNPPPYGATVVCQPGCLLATDAPYVHAELALIDDQPKESDGTFIPAPPDTPVDSNPTGTPPVTDDPAHTDMTAEGAPAPATEQEPQA